MIKDASAGESAPSPVSPPLVIVLNWPELLNAHATAR
jgi:hypothetical protein